MSSGHCLSVCHGSDIAIPPRWIWSLLRGGPSDVQRASAAA
jgi:hypothetical protein